MTDQEWREIDKKQSLAGLKVTFIFFAGVSAFTEEDTRCEAFSRGRQRFYCKIFEKPIADMIRNIFGLRRSDK